MKCSYPSRGWTRVPGKEHKSQQRLMVLLVLAAWFGPKGLLDVREPC